MLTNSTRRPNCHAPSRRSPSTGAPEDEIEPVSIGAARLAADPAEQYEQVEGMLVRVDDLFGVVQGPTKRFNNGDAEIAFVPQAVLPYLPGGRVFQHDPQNMAALMYVGSGLGADLPDLNWGDQPCLRP